ncbi:MAG: hypothetical protein ACREBB_06850 [Nitrosotalea sp.]
MTYYVSKPARNTSKAVEGSLEDNAKLYKLLEKYDEKMKKLV